MAVQKKGMFASVLGQMTRFGAFIPYFGTNDKLFFEISSNQIGITTGYWQRITHVFEL